MREITVPLEIIFDLEWRGVKALTDEGLKTCCLKILKRINKNNNGSHSNNFWGRPGLQFDCDLPGDNNLHIQNCVHISV